MTALIINHINPTTDHLRIMCFICLHPVGLQMMISMHVMTRLQHHA